MSAAEAPNEKKNCTKLRDLVDLAEEFAVKKSCRQRVWTILGMHRETECQIPEALIEFNSAAMSIRNISKPLCTSSILW